MSATEIKLHDTRTFLNDDGYSLVAAQATSFTTDAESTYGHFVLTDGSALVHIDLSFYDKGDKELALSRLDTIINAATGLRAVLAERPGTERD